MQLALSKNAVSLLCKRRLLYAVSHYITKRRNSTVSKVQLLNFKECFYGVLTKPSAPA